jgi:3-deoxy-D-manno-octulosonate 8-phosphate phosphatase (KDO 8-P phosphatase)
VVSASPAPGGRSREEALRKARPIRLLLTDCDGVLTDAGVYYGSRGEAMKRFSIRDGMGVERLREIAGIETGIVSGETASAIARRAAKLAIREAHLGVRDKLAALQEIAERRRLDFSQIAYIGDDVNDLPAMTASGLSACPRDALPEVVACADYVCALPGGQGAFREFAELLILGAGGAFGREFQ